METTLQALGMIEFNSIAAGIAASDRMVKAAGVTPLYLKTICPGKFIAAVHGQVAEVESSIEAGKADAPDTVVDHFVIPRISPEVVAAMSGTNTGIHGPALGIIETFSAPSAILAADHAGKAANIFLSEVRIAMGLGGKAFCTFTGEVAAVESAVEAGADSVKESGLLVRREVIPALDSQVRPFVL